MWSLEFVACRRKQKNRLAVIREGFPPHRMPCRPEVDPVGFFSAALGKVIIADLVTDWICSGSRRSAGRVLR